MGNTRKNFRYDIVVLARILTNSKNARNLNQKKYLSKVKLKTTADNIIMRLGKQVIRNER